MSTIETDAARNLEDERRRFDGRELEDREPQAIEQEIDATRADMRATLEALERRWSVDRLIDLTVGRIRARGGEFAGNLTDAATQNPVPLLLASIGVGWMILASRRGERPDDYSRARAGERTGNVRERTAAAAETVRDAMESTRDSVRHAAESSRETLEHTAESLRSGASRAAAAAREHVQHTQARMDRLLEEQPLLLGAFGLAAGAIIGALLPTSEHEDRWFGEARDKAAKSVAAQSRARYEAARDQAAVYSAPADGADERPASRPH